MAFIEHDFNITIRDINKNTELTNKGILTFFEDIGGFHSNIAGFGLNDIEKTRLSWVLLHWKIKVIKRLKYIDGPVKVKSWTRGIFGACTIRDFELYDSKGTLCAVGTSKWALIHLENGLLRITQDIVDKYGVEDKIALNFEFKKLHEPENYSSIYNYTVSRRDIDINSHLHNLNYLDLAYEALPQDIYDNISFDNVEIMYKKEAKLYDKLKCFYSRTNNEHIITIKSEDEQNLHAIIKLN